MDYSENQSSKIMKKFKADPSVPVGIAGLLGVLIYSAYRFKKRKISMSLYLIQMRVAAQGTLVCCMSVGLAYSLYKDHLSKYISGKKN